VEGSTKKACTDDQRPALAQGCRLTSRYPLIESLFSSHAHHCVPLSHGEHGDATSLISRPRVVSIYERCSRDTPLPELLFPVISIKSPNYYLRRLSYREQNSCRRTSRQPDSEESASSERTRGG
jgi:hypothetical protein